jgi:LemA protein
MEPFNTFIWKKIFVQVGGIIAVAVVLGGFILAYNATYNNMVNLDQLADERWARITHDLIERYGGIQDLMDLRQSLGSDTSALDEVARNLSRWRTALNEREIGAINPETTNLEVSLTLLSGVLERYPELTATRGVQDFLTTLGATAVRIEADRSSYNEGVQKYNRAIDSFPASLWTYNWGFGRREYFTARIGTMDPPPVPVE